MSNIYIKSAPKFIRALNLTSIEHYQKDVLTVIIGGKCRNLRGATSEANNSKLANELQS